MLLPAEARAAAGTSARTLAPRAAAALLAAVAAGAEPPAGLAAPAEGAPAARLLLLDLREPAAIAAAADALERNDSRVQCKGRAQMRHRVCRVRAPPARSTASSGARRCADDYYVDSTLRVTFYHKRGSLFLHPPRVTKAPP